MIRYNAEKVMAEYEEWLDGIYDWALNYKEVIDKLEELKKKYRIKEEYKNENTK